MRPEPLDVGIIGAGPAGLAAAVAAREAGAARVRVFERDRHRGGILLQCIHPGFGLHYFGEELAGPEYVERFIERAGACGVEFATQAMVLHLSQDRVLTVVSPRQGARQYRCGAVVLAMGCRERSRGALNIPGTRPAGIYTAGAVQRLVNIDGLWPGNRYVVIGSGDIGLIMCRRLTLEGARVEAVVEILPYHGGLTRNVVQCLEDFDIPVYLGHRVTQILGAKRVEGVRVEPVAGGATREIPCDTLLISAGLIPENELSKEASVELDKRTLGPVLSSQMATTVPGIFAAGDVAYVHNLVDDVTREAELAGRNAAAFAAGERPSRPAAWVSAGEGVRMVAPQLLAAHDGSAELAVRVERPQRDAVLEVLTGAGSVIARKRQRMARPAEILKLKVRDTALMHATDLRVVMRSADDASRGTRSGR